MRKPLILTLVIVTLGGAGLRAQETAIMKTSNKGFGRGER
jgi:hypothetical protein